MRGPEGSALTARHTDTMRMRFPDQDERAFGAGRDALGEQFAGWLTAQKVPGDPNDAGLLMDWKFHYGDGALDVWTVADVSEFLLEWCPRKLSATPADCAEIPVSVAAFVEFLAHAGLLARGSDLPSQVRRYCERTTARFVREMGDPANFGMAKSLFSSGDVSRLPPGVADALVDELTGDDDPPVVGPVRLPDDGEQRAAIRAARVPRQLRMLADYCAPPGRPLTGKGNLRLADARHLVAALDTGDDPEHGGRRTLRSAEDLPSLHRLVHLALEAGVVRRKQGKLVAVARFAGLDEVAAYERVVRTAIISGLSGPGVYFPAISPVRAVADECVIGLLADLLDAGSAGLPSPVLVDSMAEFVAVEFPMLPDFLAGLIPGWVRTQLERLEELGVVTVTGEDIILTPAGVPVSVGLVEGAGVEVLRRPDPATCDASAIVDLLGALEAQEWTADASAWLAARPDRVAAADELVDAVCAEGRDPVAVVAGLDGRHGRRRRGCRRRGPATARRPARRAGPLLACREVGDRPVDDRPDEVRRRPRRRPRRGSRRRRAGGADGLVRRRGSGPAGRDPAPHLAPRPPAPARRPRGDRRPPPGQGRREGRPQGQGPAPKPGGQRSRTLTQDGPVEHLVRLHRPVEDIGQQLLDVGAGGGDTAGQRAHRLDAGAASGLVDAAHQLGGSLGLGILVTVSAAAGSTTLDAAHLLADRVATALAAGTGMLALALVVVLALIVRPGCDAGTRTYAELRNRCSSEARGDELLVRGHPGLGIGKPSGHAASAGRSPCYVLRRSDGPSPTPSEGAPDERNLRRPALGR